MENHDVILISALQHYLFCQRQYALIHIEQVWAENRLTAEGQVLHQKAHEGKDESRPGIRITRGLKVGSARWGLRGVCDVVEFYGRAPRFTSVTPIEYKRGKPKSHCADELQLCAQAVCLEEMLGIGIPTGYLFYGKTRRRTEVNFDTELRELLSTTIKAIRGLNDTGTTPSAIFDKGMCNACSLIDLCKPHLAKRKLSTAQWFANQLQSMQNPTHPVNS